ncbi:MULTISPECIES: S1 family peptidase [unclassified Crossiella]|uniref:S1 family peptidase n=1 Tax=unclassified Crossiella TaxID=2620835 RepID=UPI001FFEE834|nr:MULTISPECIES: S1 family peptidase [unclassified Crossiella]MCK2238285.1 S1 family peptidase [Crossiella sp. S99.2]MCK2256325.1 S1 family peptidase [Crossiella sp. S99.1]
MRARHKRINRPKIVVTAATITLAAAVVIALPQANAANTDAVDPAAAPTETLRSKASIPGTAWAEDPQTGQVVVTADSTVKGDKWNTLMSTVGSIGTSKVRVQRAPGKFTLFAEGGDAIFSGNSRCSLGFNVTTNAGAPAILTAGHCVTAARRWSLTQGGAPIATARQSRFPGNGDFALLTYDNPATRPPSAVDTGGGRIVQIRRAAAATVNQRVFRMGSTTGLRNGRVTALGATVNYPEGTVTGLIQTTVCAEPGDSGGSLFTQDGSAIGLTSGGSGDCRSGGVTFFQPVTTALAAVGAKISGT